MLVGLRAAAPTRTDSPERPDAKILELGQEPERIVGRQAPALLEICGCATLNAAKILGETADVRRFKSRHAYARHNDSAPLLVWSGNNERHRLSRAGIHGLTPRSIASPSPKRTATRT